MMTAVPPPRLELWGGIECTVNRVGDRYFDQLDRNGHAGRPADLDRLAALGLRALRYPVLWERHQPTGAGPIDWTWADDRLARLRSLGVRPIVGLVHHGSGPRHTSLVAPTFAPGLAAYARAVAERFPWVADYTPVNEPLTTARFSGLYGHWYPHGRDDRTFVRALLNQCRAVVLAMRAIRAVNPAARLVQTDDLGKVHSTPPLAYQADFENERRWLGWDLLCGRVGHTHPLWAYLRRAGATEAELGWFADHPCPPDMIGVNYYITSERFLDHRLDLYPAHVHGGNGRHRYADVEAVRGRDDGVAGAGPLLREAWDRYRLPVAITEAHLGCTREEQMRWLWEVWREAEGQRSAGVDVRAVTVWSLLGCHDWNSMVTRDAGHYEPGAFDLRGPGPRPTALAHLVADLAAGRAPGHPVLAGPGWWRRPDRLHHAVPRLAVSAPEGRPPRPILVVGEALGRAFARVCRERGLAVRLLSPHELDVTDARAVKDAVSTWHPWAIVHATDDGRIDDAEYDPDRYRRGAVLGPTVLAQVCATTGVRLLTFSSDQVFDGRRAAPYVERDAVAPLNEYGLGQADAERAVRVALPSALVVRTGPRFGPWEDDDVVAGVLRALAAGQEFPAADDVTVSPTYVPDLVHAGLDLLIDGEQGVWHLANPGATTWAAFARAAAGRAGFNPGHIGGAPVDALGRPARRPRYSALGSERGAFLPPLEQALDRYFRERPFERSMTVPVAVPADGFAPAGRPA